MTDSLRVMTRAQERYLDWISQKEAESRTGEEIAADVIQKAGLIVKPA